MSQTPRRSRYRFTALKDGETRQVNVLCHGGVPGALLTLAENGYSNPRLHDKPRAQERSWDINEDALAEAKRTLDIQWPVTITVKHSEKHNGICRTNFTRQRHKITLRPGIDPEKASIVLWHELGHCAYDERKSEQFGHDADVVMAASRVETRSHRYKNRPSEKYARDCEDLHYVAGSLTVAR